jgi:hypothetical protein
MYIRIQSTHCGASRGGRGGGDSQCTAQIKLNKPLNKISNLVRLSLQYDFSCSFLELLQNSISDVELLPFQRLHSLSLWSMIYERKFNKYRRGEHNSTFQIHGVPFCNFIPAIFMCTAFCSS